MKNIRVRLELFAARVSTAAELSHVEIRRTRFSNRTMRERLCFDK
jgi:hypothetical protein